MDLAFVASMLFQKKAKDVDQDEMGYASRWLTQVSYSAFNDNRPVLELFKPLVVKPLSRSEMAMLRANLFLPGRLRGPSHYRKAGAT